MKWLIIFSLGLLGCGDDPPPTVGGGGDRIPTGNIGGPGDTGGAGGGGGAGGAGGAAPKGACDNGTDLDAIEGAPTAFETSLAIVACSFARPASATATRTDSASMTASTPASPASRRSAPTAMAAWSAAG